MIKLAATESENSNGESTLHASALKPTSSKRTAVSPAAAKSAVPPPSKKGLVMHSFDSRSFFCFYYLELVKILNQLKLSLMNLNHHHLLVNY